MNFSLFVTGHRIDRAAFQFVRERLACNYDMCAAQGVAPAALVTVVNFCATQQVTQIHTHVSTLGTSLLGLSLRDLGTAIGRESFVRRSCSWMCTCSSFVRTTDAAIMSEKKRRNHFVLVG